MDGFTKSPVRTLISRLIKTWKSLQAMNEIAKIN